MSTSSTEHVDDDPQIDKSEASSVAVRSNSNLQPQIGVPSRDGTVQMDTKMMALELKSGDTETTSENTLQGLRVGEQVSTSASAYSQADHIWDNHTKKSAPALASHLPHEWHDTQNEKDLDGLPFILPDLPELPHPVGCPITCYYQHCSVHQQRSNHQGVDLPLQCQIYNHEMRFLLTIIPMGYPTIVSTHLRAFISRRQVWIPIYRAKKALNNVCWASQQPLSGISHSLQNFRRPFQRWRYLERRRNSLSQIHHRHYRQAPQAV
ncbi:hypothetical protein L207DRAFT_609454 [Hyaloscypha variabilis F]|uniref:Uncharacterized protein n=1 Tax=Hyaloscypha variabilis (strain UAMH 11265 / GT02V1 / F) TaxID=1149755 RepID=A0A2J6R2R5_HYAVF|nr:hypothetical protein L207DRAFT_609454 [Hyaloscypha variabilis F]